MEHTHDLPPGPSAPHEPAPGAPVTAPAERPLTIRFTGSGSEYFRIWIVNLLLSIVTLSLYRPFAKVRRLKYFHGNTFVDDHALGFHGNPWRMLRGYLLVGAMAVCYSVAGRVSATAGLVAFVAVFALWPALWRASMQFRLANTSWRGLRFRFTGDLAGAYAALLPLFVPSLIALAMGFGLDDRRTPPAWYLQALLALFGLGALLLPLAWWNLKRYQHGHYALGQLQTRLEGGSGQLYWLSVRVVLMFIGMFAATFAVAIVLGTVLGMTQRLSFAAGLDAETKMALAGVAGVLVYLVVLVATVPYATSRLQNLVWNGTTAPALRFDSHLRFRSLLGLTVKNWLLVLVTLGLYWPFAAVATWRLRVQSVTPQLADDIDRLHAQASQRVDDASGEMAGDFFGLDIGL